jgi:hypothetical protein
MKHSVHGLSTRAALLLMSGSFVVAACGNEPAPPREPAPPTVLPAPAPAPAPEHEAEPTPEELPIVDDFAAEAEQAIDEKTYRAQLDALYKEIATDMHAATP